MRRMAASVAACILAGCLPRDDLSTPERALQTCFRAVQKDDRAEMKRCYSRNWPYDEGLESYDAGKRAAYEIYRREVLARSTVEIAEQRPARDGNPDVTFIVPLYHRPDGGVDVDGALWTELRRIDGRWLVWAEHNDLFQ